MSASSSNALSKMEQKYFDILNDLDLNFLKTEPGKEACQKIGQAIFEKFASGSIAAGKVAMQRIGDALESYPDGTRRLECVRSIWERIGTNISQRTW